jgi:hypothetical protein
MDKELVDRGRRAADLRVLIDPDSWPRWPVLPLKRWDKERHTWDFGTVFADRRPIVYRVSIFAIDKPTGTKWGDIFAELSREEYESPAQMVVAGWEVD